MSHYITDTETTGVAKTDEIIQLAYIKVPEHRKEFLETPLEEITKHAVVNNFNPNVTINPRAFEVHGISKLKLIGKPSSNTVKLPEDTKLLIAHNAPFDVRMLSKTDERFAAEQIKAICTMSLTKKIEKSQGGLFGLDNYQLRTILEKFHPDQAINFKSQFHNALDDCVMCLLIMRTLWANFPFIHTLDDLHEHFFNSK